MKKIKENKATVNKVNAVDNRMDGKKEKKKFYKKKRFWLIVLLILLIGNAGSSGEKTEVKEATKTVTQVEEKKKAKENKRDTEEKDKNDTKEFLDKVKEQIAGSVDTVYEHITDVTLKEKDLYITVDLSKVNPEPLTIEDIAISRVGSITDSLFDMEKKYLKMWNTVTIDFGKVGKTTLTKTKHDAFFSTEEYYKDFK